MRVQDLDSPLPRGEDLQKADCSSSHYQLPFLSPLQSSSRHWLVLHVWPSNPTNPSSVPSIAQQLSFLSASPSPLQRNPATMTSSAAVNATKTIHTAACLIIGDEVLGGKVSFSLWAS